MALTVEDGTGLETADAFISEAFADTYHAALGNTAWAAGTTELKEQAIRRATVYISESFNWKGFPVRYRDQALAWPRTYVDDKYGYGVDSDIVPSEVQKATAEVALRELATPGTMLPDFDPSATVKMEKVGPLAVEYALTRTDAKSTTPVLSIVTELLGPLLRGGGGTRISGGSHRV